MFSFQFCWFFQWSFLNLSALFLRFFLLSYGDFLIFLVLLNVAFSRKGSWRCTFPIFHQSFPPNFWWSLWLVEGGNLNSNPANHKLQQKFRGKNWWKIGKVYIFINLFWEKATFNLIPVYFLNKRREKCWLCKVSSPNDFSTPSIVIMFF